MRFLPRKPPPAPALLVQHGHERLRRLRRHSEHEGAVGLFFSLLTRPRRVDASQHGEARRQGAELLRGLSLRGVEQGKVALFDVAPWESPGAVVVLGAALQQEDGVEVLAPVDVLFYFIY